MKIKKGLELSTDDFWYDLTMGGYLKPFEILEDPVELKKVEDSIAVLLQFEASCEEQIEGFFQ